MVGNELKMVETCRKWPKMTDNHQKMTEMCRKSRQITENVPKMVETGQKFAVNRPKMGEKYQKWLTMTKSWKLKMVENGRKWSENYRRLRKMADNDQKMAENGP